MEITDQLIILMDEGEENKTHQYKHTAAFSAAIPPSPPPFSGMSCLVIQEKLHALSPYVDSHPSSFHWHLLCFLRVWREHVNILLQPAACQRRRPRQRRASSSRAVLGCVFASTRQKIHVITSEAQEAVPPDRTACVGSTLSGLRWLIPLSTRGCVCKYVCVCVCVCVCVYVCILNLTLLAPLLKQNKTKTS